MLVRVHLLRELFHLASYVVELSNKLIVLLILDADLIIGALALGLRHEHQAGIAARVRREEDALERADFVDEHAVQVLALGTIDFSLHGAHNCQQQVHEHNRVENNAEQEEEHLGVAEALSIVNLKADDGADENLAPDLDVLAQPLVLPVPEGLHFLVFVIRRLNLALRVLRGLLVQDLAHRLEHICKA